MTIPQRLLVIGSANCARQRNFAQGDIENADGLFVRPTFLALKIIGVPANYWACDMTT
jgi:hypothetical protein